MIKKLRIISLACLIIFLFSTCTTSTGDPSLVTFEYLSALVNKETGKIISLSCNEWETNAIMDVDSLMNIRAELNNVTCYEVGREGDEAYVVCSGIIKLTYDAEIQEIDLNTRKYTLRLENNDWRVCNYQ